MDAFDITSAHIGEEHQIIMCAGGKEVFDEILILFGSSFARGHADDTFAAASLRAIGTYISPLDQTGMAQRDDHSFIGDQIFDGDVSLVGYEIC